MLLATCTGSCKHITYTLRWPQRLSSLPTSPHHCWITYTLHLKWFLSLKKQQPKNKGKLQFIVPLCCSFCNQNKVRWLKLLKWIQVKCDSRQTYNVSREEFVNKMIPWKQADSALILNHLHSGCILLLFSDCFTAEKHRQEQKLISPWLCLRTENSQFVVSTQLDSSRISKVCDFDGVGPHQFCVCVRVCIWQHMKQPNNSWQYDRKSFYNTVCNCWTSVHISTGNYKLLSNCANIN